MLKKAGSDVLIMDHISAVHCYGRIAKIWKSTTLSGQLRATIANRALLRRSLYIFELLEQQVHNWSYSLPCLNYYMLGMNYELCSNTIYLEEIQVHYTNNYTNTNLSYSLGKHYEAGLSVIGCNQATYITTYTTGT